MQESLFTRRVVLGGLAAAGIATFGSFKGAAAQARWSLPPKRGFQRIEKGWIPLSRKVNLSARFWIPDGADAAPVGVVLEYIPYRTRDLTRGDDDEWGANLASHGFAFVRIDMRGSGDSDGVKYDEFETVERADILEAIDWLSRQPWCNGSVGMRGHSWGGNACLTTAAKNPPALKAILPSCASGDRFRKDLHWVGGSPTMSTLFWAAMLKTVIALPPDPDIVGEKWREMWETRLSGAAPVAAQWLSHQRADEYWARESGALEFSNIRCPVYAVSGLQDGFTNEVLDILALLDVPRKGMIGTWGHFYPGKGVPGPAHEDWLAEELRWWSQWLAREETGIMSEPMLQVYVEDAAPVQVAPADVPGSWITQPVWPERDVPPLRLHLGDGRLSDMPGADIDQTIPHDHVVGLGWREAISAGAPEDLPREQSDDDRYSLVFDGDVLDAPVTIIGRPRLEVRVKSDQPIAALAVRITELKPDGSSWPITFGGLNLTHRAGSEKPLLAEAGTYYDIAVDLKFASRRIDAGSRIRVALSNTLWPMVLPSPRPAQLVVRAGESSRILLPVKEIAGSPVPDPVKAEVAPQTEPSAVIEKVDRGGKVTITKRTSASFAIDGVGTTAGFESEQIMQIDEADMSRSSYSARYSTSLSRGDWQTRVTGQVDLELSVNDFQISEITQAFDGAKQVFEKTFSDKIPRQFC